MLIHYYTSCRNYLITNKLPINNLAKSVCHVKNILIDTKHDRSQHSPSRDIQQLIACMSSKYNFQTTQLNNQL